VRFLEKIDAERKKKKKRRLSCGEDGGNCDSEIGFMDQCQSLRGQGLFEDDDPDF
jgi:hypothetical protein